MSIKGKVVLYNSVKGFGFIRYATKDGTKDIYTHHSQFIGCKKLNIGQCVKFEIGENEHGPIARSVEPLFGR